MTGTEELRNVRGEVLSARAVTPSCIRETKSGFIGGTRELLPERSSRLDPDYTEGLGVGDHG